MAPVAIHVSQPLLLGREAEYVQDCLDRVELTWQGSYVKRFEEEFARFCGVKAAVACSNGTAALHLAMLALNIKPGDHVLMPAITYVATANAVRYCGGVPVFCDIDPETWTIDVEDVERQAARLLNECKEPAAVLPVHLYGAPADMRRLGDVASAFGMHIIEDAAEAHGATYDRSRVGSIGDIGTFSFYGNKLITCGEGGMATTDDPELAEAMRLYRGQGMGTGRRFWHTVVGYNYRLTNLQAAIGLAQLEDFETHAKARHTVVAAYRARLEPHVQMQRALAFTRSADWMATVLVPKGVSRDAVMCDLAEAGIETRPVFIPIPDLPPYRGITPPVAADIAARGINLPTHGALSPEMITLIADTVLHAVTRRG